MVRSGSRFVGVVFESEIALQELQATSISTHLDPAQVREIVLIDNTRRGLGAAVEERLQQAYGAHAEVLTILRPGEICLLPVATGWRAQQVLKLEIARRFGEGRYIVLDAKNHFIRPPADDFFLAMDGRPRLTVHGYRDHPLRGSLERCARYLGVDPESVLDRFPTTITPFPLDVEQVIALLDSVEADSGRSFAKEFVSRELTEFFLYSLWIEREAGGISAWFDTSQPPGANVWPSTATASGVAAALDRARESDVPLFSIHRTALANLDREASASLEAFWVAAGLFPDGAAARRFVDDFRRRFERERSRRRIMEAPPRIVGAVRRRLSQG